MTERTTSQRGLHRAAPRASRSRVETGALVRAERPLGVLRGGTMIERPSGPADRLAALVGLAVAALGLPSASQAQSDERPHVRLVLEGTWPTELGHDVQRDLEASLREQGIALDVGDAEDPRHPVTVLATLRVGAPSIDAPMAHVAIEDALTRKLVERDLALGGTPPDVWSVVVASATDELLRASWVELRMRDAPAPAIDVPAPVLAQLEEVSSRSLGIAPPSLGPLGLAFDAELTVADGALLAGGRVGLAVASLEPLLVTIAAGAAGLFPRENEGVRIDGAWVFADLDASLALVPRGGALRLDLLARVRGGAAIFGADVGTSSRLVAHGDVAPAVLIAGGLRGAVALSGPSLLTLGVLVGALPASVTVGDGRDDVVRLAGPTVLIDVGAEVWP